MPRSWWRRQRRSGSTAIAVTDRNTLAGVVRAHLAAKEVGGSNSSSARGSISTTRRACSPIRRDRAAYGRLCRLLTLGQRRAEKGKCTLHLADVAAHADGLIFIADSPEGMPAGRRISTGSRGHRRSSSSRSSARLRLGSISPRGTPIAATIAPASPRSRNWRTRVGLPLVATNAVLYHAPHRRPLQDVLTCIREKCTIDEAGLRLEANAERHLKSPQEMARLFNGHEDALARTIEIADACTFSLDELRYEYPDEPVPERQDAAIASRRI